MYYFIDIKEGVCKNLGIEYLWIFYKKILWRLLKIKECVICEIKVSFVLVGICYIVIEL